MRRESRQRAVALVALVVGLSACGSRDEVTHPSVNAGPEARTARLAAATRYACAIDGARVVCWGRHPRFDGSPAPVEYTELAGAVELAASDTKLCARRDDGVVTCNVGYFSRRGQNDEVELGEVAGVRDARALAVGDAHVCVLDARGDVFCFGKNASGQLGDPALGDRGAPPRTPVVRGARAIAARGDRTVAIVGNEVWLFGRALGSETAVTPTAIAGLEGAEAVALGSDELCILDAERNARCAATMDGADVREVPGPFAEIALGDGFGCGRAPDGEVRCWGEAAERLGVTAPARGATELTLGAQHGCVAHDDGVGCFGLNEDGQALGSFSHDRPPSRVYGLDDAVDVRTSSGGRCALRRDGRVVCWGRLDPLPWSDAQRPPRTAFTPVERDGVAGATAIAMGAEHGCALVEGGRLRCWGSNEHGQLGVSEPEIALEAVEVPDVLGARAVCAAADYTCVVDAGAKVRCVGEAGEGGWTTRRFVEVAGAGQAVAIDCGALFACARDEAGRVACWGDDLRVDRRVVPGRAPRPAPPRPPRAREVARDAVEVKVGDAHACVRLRDRAIACFGYGDTGQLGVSSCGDGAERCVVSPRPVPFPGAETADDFFVGRGTCFRRDAEPLSCVGARDAHYDGFSLEPEALPGTEGATRMTAGCALSSDGHVVCWGSNREGEVGDGVLRVATEAAPVPLR